MLQGKPQVVQAAGFPPKFVALAVPGAPFRPGWSVLRLLSLPRGQDEVRG